MKTLFVLRHAKTQPDAPHGDWTRELVERGRNDAELMGRYLRNAAVPIDLILSSDARRAQQTAELVNAALEPAVPLTLDHGIYDANLDDLIRIVRGLADDATRVMLVGHNPGCSELVEWLVGAEAAPDKLPTAALAQIEFDLDRWREIGPGSGRLAAFVTPRMLR